SRLRCRSGLSLFLDHGESVRIGINAQLLSFAPGYRSAGVSRYIEALIRELPQIVAEDDQVIAFGGGEQGRVPALIGDRIEWVPSRLPTERPPLRIAWEQTAGALVKTRHRLSLLHSPVNV